MTDEGFKIQASFKTRSNPNANLASLLNVRANTPDELNENLDALIANLPKINEVEALLGAVEVINTAFSPAPAQQPGVVTQAAPQQAASAAPAASQGQVQQAAPPADGNIARYNPSWGDGPGNPKFMLAPGLPSPKGEPAPVCEHGPQQYKEFTKKDGSKYLRAHACVQKGSNCPMKFHF